MAQEILLLDCTLRDGAYIVDAKFGTAAMRGIIKHMQEAGAEIVECGWLKNAAHEVGTSFFHVPSDLEQYLVERKDDVVYSAMIDWDRYDLSYLPPCDGKSINAIRVVFPHGKYKEGIEVGKGGEVPRDLQNVHADGAGFEREQGYLYPHDFPGHWVKQQYLPNTLKNVRYYEYGDNKTEQAARVYWDKLKGSAEGHNG